jgi:fructokinase
MDMCSVTGDEREALGKLIRLYNLRIAALTKGGEGSLLMTPDAASFLEAPEVKIADTVGAGDSFTAALVTGMLKGYSLDSIHQGANRLAAYVCTQNGATPRLPDVIVKEYSD